jgi:hypothetical protein
MSSTNSAPGMLWRFDLVSQSFLAQPGLPFAEALPETRIEQAFAEEGIDFASSQADEDDIVYTPAVTLWAFLSQMLHPAEQRSCLAAVARIAVLWAALGKLGAHGQPPSRPPAQSHRTTRHQTATEATRPADRTARASPREISGPIGDVNPYTISGSAIRS